MSLVFSAGLEAGRDRLVARAVVYELVAGGHSGEGFCAGEDLLVKGVTTQGIRVDELEIRPHLQIFAG